MMATREYRHKRFTETRMPEPPFECPFWTALLIALFILAALGGASWWAMKVAANDAALLHAGRVQDCERDHGVIDSKDDRICHELRRAATR